MRTEPPTWVDTLGAHRCYRCGHVRGPVPRGGLDTHCTCVRLHDPVTPDDDYPEGDAR